MGFMDKAKKMAEQAQQKLDEAQKSFNEKQGTGGGGQQGGPAVEYDKHGRPVNSAADAAPAPQAAAPPPGDPLADPSPAAPPPGDPLADPSPAAPEAPAAPSSSGGPTLDPSAPGAADSGAPAKAEGDPLLSDEQGSRHGYDAEKQAGNKPPSGGLPGMTSGDPLG
jgi:hypothetical protein